MSDTQSKVIQLADGGFAIPAEQVLKEREATQKVLMELRNSASLFSRSNLFNLLGKTFIGNGNRDLYKILGYPVVLTQDHYNNRYSRQEIAKAAINRPVDSSWRKKPRITDDTDPEVETLFEKAVKALQKKIKFFSYMVRLDKLASLGNYAVMLYGFGDGKKLEEKVEGAKKLLFLQVYKQANAAVKEIEKDEKEERYGLPKLYSLRMNTITGLSGGVGGTGVERSVHYSRVLHVASDVLESDVYGTPALEAVYNRLQDIETISGGSAETYWKGARPGYGLTVQDGYNFNQNDKDALNTELAEFDNELRRFLRLKGIDIKELKNTITSPREFIDILIDLVACGLNIPKRILMGSERGELASSQDKNNWNERMENRREDFIEPVIIRPFINDMIEVGVLPEPADGEYELEWDEFEVPGDEAIVKNAKDGSEAIRAYADSPGAQLVMPLVEYLQRFWKYSKKEAEELAGDYEVAMEEENAQIEEERVMEEDEDNV